MKYSTLFGVLGIALLSTSSTLTPLRAQSRSTYPLGGESITGGTVRSILWNPKELTGPVRIQLWDGQRGSWTTLSRSVPGEAGRFDWNVSPELNGTRFRIKLTSNDASVMTRSFFSIL